VGADIFDPVELTRGNGAPAGHTTPHNTVRGRDMIGHMPKARRPRGAHHKIIKHHRQAGAGIIRTCHRAGRRARPGTRSTEPGPPSQLASPAVSCPGLTTASFTGTPGSGQKAAGSSRWCSASHPTSGTLPTVLCSRCQRRVSSGLTSYAF